MIVPEEAGFFMDYC